MFKNVCKNIKTYKFSYAKNIEILVQFSKKILRTLKVLKFQISKNVGSRILQSWKVEAQSLKVEAKTWKFVKGISKNWNL